MTIEQGIEIPPNLVVKYFPKSITEKREKRPVLCLEITRDLPGYGAVTIEARSA
jgi:hypothetical protein